MAAMSRGRKPRISNNLAITKQSKKHVNCQKVSAFDGLGVVFNFVALLKPWLSLNFAQRCENVLVKCHEILLSDFANQPTYRLLYYNIVINSQWAGLGFWGFSARSKSSTIFSPVGQSWISCAWTIDKSVYFRDPSWPSDSEHRIRPWVKSLKPLSSLLYTHIDDVSFIFNCTPSQECLNRDLVMEEFWDLLFSAL